MAGLDRRAAESIFVRSLGRTQLMEATQTILDARLISHSLNLNRVSPSRLLHFYIATSCIYFIYHAH